MQRVAILRPGSEEYSVVAVEGYTGEDRADVNSCAATGYTVISANGIYVPL